jgi:pyrroline-5-carboxylate reductase
MTDRVAVIGAGKMGEALLSGMLRAGPRRTCWRPPVVAIVRTCCASGTASK